MNPLSPAPLSPAPLSPRFDVPRAPRGWFQVAWSDEIASRSSDVMFVVVSGPGSDLAPSTGHTIPFATSAAEASGGVVLAEVWVEQEDGPDRADSLAGVLGDPELSAQITTVDDLDLSFGPTTVVLALAAVKAGDIGHYGVGDIADLAAPLPPEEQ